MSPHERDTCPDKSFLSFNRDGGGSDESNAGLFGRDSLFNEFTSSFQHAAIRTPYDGLAQIVDHYAGKGTMPALTAFGEPEAAAFMSKRWHVQQFGSALGMLVPFSAAAGLSHGISRFTLAPVARGLATSAGEKLVARSLLGVADCALAGFVHDTVLVPNQSAGGDFWTNRLKNGLAGAATMGTLSLTGTGLSMGWGTHGLRDRILTNFVAGIPAGFVGANVRSHLFENRGATAEEVGHSMYGASFGGAALALLPSHRLERKTESDANLTRFKRSLEPSNLLDTKTTEGARIGHDRDGSPPKSQSRPELDLKMPEKISLTELSKQLWPEFGVDAIVCRPAFTEKTSFKSYKEFFETGTVEEKCSMSVYKPSGLDIEIALPESYDADLHEVRELRLLAEAGKRLPDGRDPVEVLAQHKYGDRLLPEDMIPYLRSLPDATLVKRIVLLEHKDPADPWFQAKYRKNFEGLASAHYGGIINFYAAERSSRAEVRDIIFHEWGHLQEYSDPLASRQFRYALVFENQTNHRYARKNPAEHWAVNAECHIFALESGHFLDYMSQAPVKAYIFGRALERSLDHATESKQAGTDHDQYKVRAKTLTGELEPVARQRLRDLIQSNPSAQEKAAIRVVGLLEPATRDPHTDLDTLQSVARGRTDAKSRQLAFNSLMKLTESDPGKRVQILVDLSSPDSLSSAIARDALAKQLVEKLTDPKVPRCFFSEFTRDALEKQIVSAGEGSLRSLLPLEIFHEVALRAAETMGARGQTSAALAIFDKVLTEVETNGCKDTRHLEKVAVSVSNLVQSVGQAQYRRTARDAMFRAREMPQGSSAVVTTGGGISKDYFPSELTQAVGLADRVLAMPSPKPNLILSKLAAQCGEQLMNNGSPETATRYLDKALADLSATLGTGHRQFHRVAAMLGSQ